MLSTGQQVTSKNYVTLLGREPELQYGHVTWVSGCPATGETGCEEGQFYSMPFGQAVANMYWPTSHFT